MFKCYLYVSIVYSCSCNYPASQWWRLAGAYWRCWVVAATGHVKTWVEVWVLGGDIHELFIEYYSNQSFLMFTLVAALTCLYDCHVSGGAFLETLLNGFFSETFTYYSKQTIEILQKGVKCVNNKITSVYLVSFLFNLHLFLVFLLLTLNR